MASSLRNTSISVYYRLLQILLQSGWTTTEIITLEKSKANPLVFEVPEGHRARGFPWVFMNASGTPWSGGVVVKVQNVVVSPASINHIDAQVRFAAAPSGAVQATVVRWAAAVREGSPEGQVLESAPLPLIAFQITDELGSAYGIGTAMERKEHLGKIMIYGATEGQCQDLGSLLRRMIRVVPVINFADRQYLAADGSLDPHFNFAAQYLRRCASANYPRFSLMEPRPGGSKKERHRGLVTFQVDRVE